MDTTPSPEYKGLTIKGWFGKDDPLIFTYVWDAEKEKIREIRRQIAELLKS